MTGCQPADPACAQEPRCTDGYERLRLQAVRPAGGADRCGLAILVRQGVAGWLRSLAELPPEVATEWWNCTMWTPFPMRPSVAY